MLKFELKQQHATALAKAEGIIAAAERQVRALTPEEKNALDSTMREVNGLTTQLKAMESQNTISRMAGPSGAIFSDAPRNKFQTTRKMQLSPEYMEDFYAYMQSGGRTIGATLYEGSQGSGGYAVPIMVDDQIVPLAPQEMSVRKIATVLATSNDIKFPVKGAFGVATAKAETSAFTESDPTLTQFTLSAFMAGIQETISWELAQDVPAFQAFAVDDMILAQSMYEENLYINGSGSGQAQGIIGNIGAGVTEEPDSNGNLISVNGTLDLIGKLNAAYHPNATWLMARATSIIIRKSQVETNLFNPIFQRVGNQDFLHGYPVEYATAMPAAARGAAPIVFGDFKRGYIIGDRGGSGINVKVLDQPQAANGLLVLLAYRRTDGRVRRSEALQQYNIAAS